MPKLVILTLSLWIYCLFNTANSAIFENVKVLVLETHNVAFVFLTGNAKQIFINSDDTLARYIPQLENFTVIEIENQNIPQLSANSITDLLNIRKISIVSSNLLELEPGTFNNLPKLEILDLQNNKIENIQNGVFTGLEMITLDLSSNNIKSIENQAFNNLKLKNLFLGRNKLSFWNGEWLEGTPIEVLCVRNNYIQELVPNSFNFLKVSEKVHPLIFFQRNHIKTIHPGAFNGVGYLRRLDLSNNVIENLNPGIFDGLYRVDILELHNNTLRIIDEEIFSNTKVPHLAKFHNNTLSDFPLDLLKNKQISQVWLQDNPLSCRFVEEVDDWMLNKTGDYQRNHNIEYEIPFGTFYDNMKENCV